MENCEAMTSSPHSFAYSYRLVKKCFLKICETSKCHNFLIFQPIFIRFSLLCLKIFTLSSEIEFNLLWSSSLNELQEKDQLLYNVKLIVKKMWIYSFCFTSAAFNKMLMLRRESAMKYCTFSILYINLANKLRILLWVTVILKRWSYVRRNSQLLYLLWTVHCFPFLSKFYSGN